jgi:hypothetical protein
MVAVIDAARVVPFRVELGGGHQRHGRDRLRRQVEFHLEPGRGAALVLAERDLVEI